MQFKAAGQCARKSAISEQTQPALDLGPGLPPYPLPTAPSPLRSAHLLSTRPSVAPSAPISLVISTSQGLSAFEQLPQEGVSGGLHDLWAQGWGKSKQKKGCTVPPAVPLHPQVPPALSIH